ncbi:ketopantoate reductase [Chitinophaga alhagiae]|uniref:2-dehydropantoate 2-reductase n=1 Tax=Chitinophaga alhagiae TaxID=2203219 RepID=A0ABN5LNW6_9BACT|nr:2-dehydropantoate 2-reductase [Chitinophaga alhagiae]AWO01102.1 ketopantoate reductase [Chitinophaga alhagiae]
MKTYIIGSGAIGKALAVALQLQGKDVALIRGSIDNVAAHTETIQVIQEDGQIQEATVLVSTIGNFGELDGLIVLANKSYGNEALARKLKGKTRASPLVILQNGLGVEQPFIKENYPEIYRCVLFVTGQTLAEGGVRFKPVAACPVGIVKGNVATLQRIIEQLSGSYLLFSEEAQIETVVWKKTIINSVFNSVCPLLETDNGIFHRNPAALGIAERIVLECLVIAREKGILLEAEDVLRQLLQISKSSDGQLISTLQDIRNKRQTEIGTLNLEIARIARSLNMEAAVKETSLLGELTKLKSELSI